MDIFFNENAIEVLENTDGETRTTILQLALEEVEHDLEVTEPSVHMATLHMMREQLLRVLSRQQLPQREMQGSRRNREASVG
jgi:demethoxyubiquinone hydroxylase (CLK1/Coq7/Cat5 family)